MLSHPPSSDTPPARLTKKAPNLRPSAFPRLPALVFVPWRSLALSAGIHLALGLPLLWLHLDPQTSMANGRPAASGPQEVAQVEVRLETGDAQGEQWDAEPLPEADPIPALQEPDSEAWFSALPRSESTSDVEPEEFQAPLEFPFHSALAPELQVTPLPPAEASPPLATDERIAPPAPLQASTNLAPASPLGDADPIARECPPPHYPRLARRNRWQGTVHCRLTISDKGTVAQVLVERSSGRRILDQAAVSALMLWRFEPGIRAGLAVETEILHRIVFRLE